MTAVDRDRVVAALEETWDSIVRLGAELSAADWTAPTDCPGWTVQDHVSHMIGTESALAGQPRPDVAAEGFSHVRNAIGRSNEAWVEQRRSWPPEAVLEEFRAVTAGRAKALRAMNDGDFEAETATPAGRDTYGRFMRIRVMDCWVHEQDIREALGRPGHQGGPAVELSIDEVVGAIGYIVGKQAAAPKGTSVRLVLTGAAPRTVDVAVEERATVTGTPLAAPTTTVTLPATTFMRLAGGRADGARALAVGVVAVSGDRPLGERVVTHLAYMI